MASAYNITSRRMKTVGEHIAREMGLLHRTYDIVIATRFCFMLCVHVKASPHNSYLTIGRHAQVSILCRIQYIHGYWYPQGPWNITTELECTGDEK